MWYRGLHRSKSLLTIPNNTPNPSIIRQLKHIFYYGKVTLFCSNKEIDKQDSGCLTSESQSKHHSLVAVCFFSNLSLTSGLTGSVWNAACSKSREKVTVICMFKDILLTPRLLLSLIFIKRMSGVKCAFWLLKWTSPYMCLKSLLEIVYSWSPAEMESSQDVLLKKKKNRFCIAAEALPHAFFQFVVTKV